MMRKGLNLMSSGYYRSTWVELGSLTRSNSRPLTRRVLHVAAHHQGASQQPSISRTQTHVAEILAGCELVHVQQHLFRGVFTALAAVNAVRQPLHGARVWWCGLATRGRGRRGGVGRGHSRRRRPERGRDTTSTGDRRHCPASLAQTLTQSLARLLITRSPSPTHSTKSHPLGRDSCCLFR